MPLVLTMRGDTTVLSPRSGTLYAILYNGYSCKDCFSRLATALHCYDSSKGRVSEVVAVTRTRNGAYGRRQALNDIKRVLPDIQTVYFDCADAEDDPWPPEHLKGGIFGLCNISKTPSLLVLDEHDGGTVQCLTYEELFGDDEAGESADTQLRKLVANLGVRLRK
jgi:hypothetical protein